MHTAAISTEIRSKLELYALPLFAHSTCTARLRNIALQCPKCHTRSPLTRSPPHRLKLEHLHHNCRCHCHHLVSNWSTQQQSAAHGSAQRGTVACAVGATHRTARAANRRYLPCRRRRLLVSKPFVQAASCQTLGPIARCRSPTEGGRWNATAPGQQSANATSADAAPLRAPWVPPFAPAHAGAGANRHCCASAGDGDNRSSSSRSQYCYSDAALALAR